MKSEKPIHIVCIQWGTAYAAKDINNLYSMIRRNTSFTIHFHLFSNEPPQGLDPAIDVCPEPGLNTNVHHECYNYRKTVGLCDDNLPGLSGKRVFFFDLDVLITGNLDELFTYPKDDKFYIINDWNTKGDHVGQATCYSFVVGTLGSIKADFESRPEEVIGKFGTATQQYLSAQVIEKFGPLNFWPEQWFQSFKFHCLPPVLIRRFVTAPKPNPETKVLAFHGNPNIEDAIAGRWKNPRSAKKQLAWKALYKSFRPVPWILEYWR